MQTHSAKKLQAIGFDKDREANFVEKTESPTVSASVQPVLSTAKTLTLSFAAVASFHLAFSTSLFSLAILVYFACLVELTRIRRPTDAMGVGMMTGFFIFAPQLTFFYTLFSAFAAVLWLVLAFWHGLFLYLGSWARSRFSPFPAMLFLPVFWCGLEYFRSELYPLKFSWLAGGFAFASHPNFISSELGTYGVGFILIGMAAILNLLQGKLRAVTSVSLLTVFVCSQGMLPSTFPSSGRELKLAGMQLEFPVELEVPAKLDMLKQKHPDTKLFVLSEYTFDGPVPRVVRNWCARNQTYLIVGGKDPLNGTNYYNTAFVIGPDGDVVFKQAKSVPIQFFNDGLPAPAQHIWNSPWGKIGILICYDLSYTRVVDELVRQGAELLVVPTMDLAEWGRKQHELHSLIAPARAAEYRIPIFRLASSGISQAVTPQGQIQATTSFPGQEESLYASMELSANARLPWDRRFAPVFSVVTLIAAALSIVCKKRFQNDCSVFHP